MSSILKALKKLENEASTESDIGSSPRQFHTKTSMQKRVQTDRFSNKRLSIIITSLILLVGTGLIITFKPWEKQQASMPTTDLKAELTPAAPAETKTRTPSLKQERSPSINDSETFAPLNKAVKKPALPAQTLKNESPELLVKTETDPIQMTGVFEGKPASRQPMNKSPLASEKEQAPEQKEDNAQFALIPVKQASESKLELQAIAWSGRPEKRMAVINGHIVHEGDFVERSAIKHIGRNEVVFMKGDEEWRQLFRSTSHSR